MSIDSIAGWLADTHFSLTLQETLWVVPAAQSIHILSIAVLVGSALMINLRAAGMLGASAQAVAGRYFPWFWGALAVLLVTGSMLIAAEPRRELGTPVFWWKMGLLVAGLIAMLYLRSALANRPENESGDAPNRRGAALMALSIWVAVIVCGRWIAYSAY